MAGKKSLLVDACDVASVPLSEDLADLVQRKIREFEHSREEENEKTQRAHKGRARAVAKTKIKEARQLVNSQIASTEKARCVWDLLQAQHERAQDFVVRAASRLHDIGDAEHERDACQGELNRALAVKSKLESLCRQLQQQTNALVEERRRLTDSERLRRQELADEFQHTIGDVKKKMDQQASERVRLARENEELRSRFKHIFEQYDRREKELQEQQRARELEVQVFERTLAEQAQLYRQEAAREASAQRDNGELLGAEQALRGQLQTYSNKFSHFQDALSRSDRVLGQYKRQRNKMQRRAEVLEKENRELRARTGRRAAAAAKDRDAALREKDALQERCKALQSRRQQCLEAA